MSRPLIISAAAILATAVAAALLWPDAQVQHEQGSGIAGFSMPVLVQQTTPAASGNTVPERNAGISTSAQRPLPGMTRNPRLDSLDLDALRKEYAERIRANIREKHSPERLAALRKSLEQRYSELGKYLDLAPEELKRLLDMLARFEVERDNLAGENVNIDLVVVDGVPMQVFPPGAPALGRDARSLTQRQEDEMRRVLGDKYDKWLAYVLVPDIRTSVVRFQDVFGPDANPLSDEQTETVVAALAAEQVRINRDMRNIPRSWSTDPQTSLQNSLDWALRYAPDNNRRMVQAASPYLNAAQLVDYREMLEDDRNKSIESLRAQIVRLESPRVIPPGP